MRVGETVSVLGLPRLGLLGISLLVYAWPCLAQGVEAPAAGMTDAKSTEARSGARGDSGRELAGAEPVANDLPLYVEFSYQAPASCMGEEKAFALVKRRSQRVRRQPAHATIEQTAQQRLSIVITRLGQHYHGVLTVRRVAGAPETRSMVGVSCADLVEALALTAALSIDPDATVVLDRETESPDTSASLSDSELPLVGSDDAAPPLRAEEPKHHSIRRSDRERATVSLGAVASVEKIVNQTVHLGGGLGVVISGTPHRQVLPLEFRASLQVLADPRNRSSADIYTDSFLFGAAYCPLRLGLEHSLSACVGGEVGSLSARGQGLVNASGVERLIAAVTLEAWLRSRLARRWELWLSPAVTAPLAERKFAATPGPQVLASTVPLGWRLSTGLAWTF